MNAKGKLALAAAGAAAVGMSPAPSQAQDAPAIEMRVGIIDIQANELTFGDRNTWIDYREFNEEGKFPANWMTESGYDHGQMMASAFVRQARIMDEKAPIRIFAANVFQENSNPTGSALYSRNSHAGSKRTLSVNWEGAKKALSWFKENNVTVVLTAFNGQDSVAMRSFIQETEKLGMTVFASAGNKVGAAAFPAQYPQAISVAADNKDLAFRNDPSMSTWVNFTMEGDVPLRKEGGAVDAGSSYASAKAAAFGAYYVAHNRYADRDQIRGALQRVAMLVEYEGKGEKISGLRIDEREAGREMARVARYDFEQANVRTADAAETKSPNARDVAMYQSAISVGMAF